MRGLQARGPTCRGVERDREPRVTRLDPDTDAEMRLPDAGRTQEDDVLRFRDPRRRGQMREDITAERGLVIDVEIGSSQLRV